jgi:hypothetical protein
MPLAQTAQLCAQLDLAPRAQGIAHNEALLRNNCTFSSLQTQPLARDLSSATQFL